MDVVVASKAQSQWNDDVVGGRINNLAGYSGNRSVFVKAQVLTRPLTS